MSGSQPYSFDHLNADGSPRKFVGMHRLPFDVIISSSSEHGYFTDIDSLQGKWVAGMYDKPLYEVPDDE